MTKIRVPSFAMQEVELEHVAALPTISRRGMTTTCASCGKAIQGEFFYAGFASGQPNSMFHFDCLGDFAQAIVKYPKCQKCGVECKPGTGHLANGNYIHFACEDNRAA